MANLQPPLLPATSSNPVTTLSPAISGRPAQGASSEDLNRMVLKLTESAAPPLPVEPAPSPFTRMSHAGFAALHRLVSLIEDLRSPDSGWPEDVPLSPENLLPYVEEEIQDLYTLLRADGSDSGDLTVPETRDGLHQGHPTSGSSASQMRDPARSGLPDVWQSYFTVRQVAPWLMWCAARASSQIMQLMEGIVATIALPNQSRQTGILRLATVLDIDMPEFRGRLDLATGHLLQDALSGDLLLQSDDCELCRTGLTIASLKHQVIHQIQTTTPSLQALIAGVSVEALMPGQAWQTGRIQFQIAVEFTLDADDMVVDRMLQAEVLGTVIPVDAIDVASNGAPSNLSRHPLLQFDDPAWLQQYAASVLQQILDEEGDRPSRYAHLAQPSLSQEAALIALIQDACDITEAVHHSLSHASYGLDRELRLNELTSQLMWCFGRSSFEVMQLMGGVRAALLEPELSWTTGILRLLLTLTVQTPQFSWRIDLATGKPPDADAWIVHPEAIAQSQECRWCHPSRLIQDLREMLVHQIWGQNSELQLWLQGTRADVLVTTGEWQPCDVKVSAEFAFIPDLRATP